MIASAAQTRSRPARRRYPLPRFRRRCGLEATGAGTWPAVPVCVLAGARQKGHSRGLRASGARFPFADQSVSRSVRQWSSRDLFAAVPACRCRRHRLSFEPSVSACRRKRRAQQELLPDNAVRQLSGRPACRRERDAGAAAAYYLNVLKLDPHNPDLLSRAFLSVLSNGDIDEAEQAGRPAARDRSHRSHRAAGASASGNSSRNITGTARQDFAQSVRGPVTDLTATLLSAWAQSGEGDAQAARRCHGQAVGSGLVRHLQGSARRPDPRSCQEQERRPASATTSAYKADPTALRTVEAYGRFLSRNGSKDDALKVYAGFQQGAAQPSGDRRRDRSRSPTARSCRRWSIRRRPAPPRRFTGSAPRSAAAAARISR